MKTLFEAARAEEGAYGAAEAGQPAVVGQDESAVPGRAKEVRIVKPLQFDDRTPQTPGMLRLAAVSHGLVGSEAERKALLALAEGVPGVARVSDETIPAY